MYSQNSEDAVVLKYFNGKQGVLLEIGSNDGITLSNSLALIELGFKATLVEPDTFVFRKLRKLHRSNKNVFCVRKAISNYIGTATFFESGSHLSSMDHSLLSSLNEIEIKRWQSTTEFKKINVDVIDVKTLIDSSPYKTFDFISIDAEGEDIVILRQMDLEKLKCRCICVEHNGNENILKQIIGHCGKYGLTKELLYNAENIILAK